VARASPRNFFVCHSEQREKSAVRLWGSAITYLVIYEQGKDGAWGAPDLPGLGVAAETREEVAALIREGIQIYLGELKQDGLPLPLPVTTAEHVEVAA
jgi:predicted RNase H-like HicB family nuclease